jgi:monothiol glutaredoxin
MSPTDAAGWARQFETETRQHPVFVYAKGEKGRAVCGFSRRVMEIFDRLGAPYEVRDVLADPAIRPALVAWSGWPTIPQVFVGGRFVGGCDIVTEMEAKGELKEAVRAAVAPASPAGA